MRRLLTFVVAAGPLTLALALAGCGGSDSGGTTGDNGATTTAGTTASTDATAGSTAGASSGASSGAAGSTSTGTPPGPGSGTAAGAALGSAEAAGPYMVTLTANPPKPKVAPTMWMAKVMKDGKPVKGAKVGLYLKMPSMGHQQLQLLTPSGDHYQGQIKPVMGGDWQARVTVEGTGGKGEAMYNLSITP